MKQSVNWKIEYQVRVFWCQVYQAQLWERMLNRSASLAMSTSVLKALPGKLDIKRHSPSIHFVWENPSEYKGLIWLNHNENLSHWFWVAAGIHHTKYAPFKIACSLWIKNISSFLCCAIDTSRLNPVYIQSIHEGIIPILAWSGFFCRNWLWCVAKMP